MALLFDLPARVTLSVGKGDPAAQDVELVNTIVGFARGYTRDVGFTEETVRDDLAAVIVAAASRLVVNPEQVERYQLADYAETPVRFVGWTLAELAVLNRYRKRAL